MHAGVTAHDRLESPRNVPGSRQSGTAAGLREITELLSKIAALRDNGTLTDKEFIEQKQRPLG